jgi:hypothetical protein
VTADVAGPAWSSTESGTYPGRFPLSVERHVMGMADRLVPGVTTVTLNARYYCLHGLVAAEAKAGDWTSPSRRIFCAAWRWSLVPCPPGTGRPVGTGGCPDLTATT